MMSPMADELEFRNANETGWALVVALKRLGGKDAARFIGKGGRS
jgi:hypothetical protein